MQRPGPCFLTALTLAAVLAVLCQAAEDVRHYHLSRALFRCSPLNRGLGFDGEHFWVGEFGGWVRCYDPRGRRMPSRDLGGGTIRYLGHGVATGPDFVATGAWDSIAVLPKDGSAIRHIKPSLPGNPCGVASNGQTLWVMNYQSPVLYEMTLDGKLLRQFTTAQQPSATSHDIAIDGDNHVYVLEGAGGGSRKLFEYSPAGQLLRTHNLAVPATAIAINPQDKDKTLYTVSFAGDSTVYEYRLAAGEPRDGPLPRLVRPLRYRPEDGDIVITNGENRFNRPLYGTNSAFFVCAGDKPEVLLSLPGKGGTLWVGIASPTTAKWLSDADQVITRYRAGAMRYEISDRLLGPGRLTMDVIPRADSEGAVVRLAVSGELPPVELVWAFGGASGFNQWNLDTCGYCPEAACHLKPEDCEGNEFRITETGFELRAPCHQGRPLAGTVPCESQLKVADADRLGSPTTLWDSEGTKRPILAGRRAIQGGDELYFALDWLTIQATAPKPDELPVVFAAAEARRASVAGRVRVRTPDPDMNAAVPAICSAADGIWEPPVYMHGGVAWHAPYLGWRGAYAASEFGWHNRAQTHFRAFAAVQLKEPATGKPHADPASNLARQADDSVVYTRGYIPVHPTKDARGCYDMQQVYIDQLLWHLLWTGDLEFAKEMWPVLVDHLQWEKRCFDADGDGLYENFANTFISDAHHYSGGGCTQASAYNYRAFVMAGRLAKLLGEDPSPWEKEAAKIREAMNRVLWMPESGWYAEYQDLLGLRRLHPSAELPSVYHPIDSDVPDPFQAWGMLRYVDTAIERLPIDGGGTMLFTSNWVPFIWSVRDVCGVEVTHTALANWQTGRTEQAYELWRGAIRDSMFGCRAPGACIGTSELHGRMAGLCTDFADTVGMYCRTLVEGLFGIVPDALSGELLIRPGLPAAWESASIETPEVGYAYSRQGNTETFDVRAGFRRPMRLRLRVAARGVRVAEVTVNGQPSPWKCLPSVGGPMIEVEAAQADGAKVTVRWDGPAPAQVEVPAIVGLGENFRASFGAAKLCEVLDPQKALTDVRQEASAVSATATGKLGHRTVFGRLEQEALSWWSPISFEVRPPQEITAASVDWEKSVVRCAVQNNTGQPLTTEATVACGAAQQAVRLEIAPHASSTALQMPAQALVPGTNPIIVQRQVGDAIRSAVVDWRRCDESLTKSCECVDLSKTFNDRVTEIFKHEYRSPRSPYCSLQIPLHGFGDWCYCGKSVPAIDDAKLRAEAGPAGRFVSPQGIPLATPGPGQQPNVVFTSRWDNFPAEVAIPLAGRARHAWFLVAGSTHPMHSQLDNGEIVVTYAEGAAERLALHNPTTWWPIEADYQTAIDGFCIPGPYPPRIDLGAGRATILDLPLAPGRDLRTLTVRCLANEVVVGLMSATLLRP